MTKKKTSAKKKLLPAAGMLAISATMLASSTYAWFTMNKEVSVKGMQVKAKAEKGLLINEIATSADTNWDEEAKATTTGVTLIPMSSADMTTWAHANSVSANDAAKAGNGTVGAKLSSAGYEIFTLAETAGGKNLGTKKLDFIQKTAPSAGTTAEANVYYKEKDGTAAAIGDNDDGAFIKYTYYVKSSGSNAITLNQDLTNDGDDTLYVKEIKVSGLDKNDSALAHDLDKTLRVAVYPDGGSPLTFAPVAGADTDYYITSAYSKSGDTVSITNAKAVLATKGSATLDTSGSSAVSTWKATTDGNTTEGLSLATLPATTSDGAKIDVYIWFEGEDTNCNTDNIYSELDSLTVDVIFGLK